MSETTDDAKEIGEKAIRFCLQCLQTGCTADEILAAWRKDFKHFLNEKEH
jgi:hypothetical protein